MCLSDYCKKTDVFHYAVSILKESNLVLCVCVCVCVQAVTGHEACVEALLQHGASVCVRDSRGRSAMHLAAACGHIAVLGSLLQAAHSQNIMPVIMDRCGYTPLHWACYNGT